MEFIEVSAKTVDDAITEALVKLGITSDHLEYEVVSAGSAGFLGIGSKPAVIKARKKFSVEDYAREFLGKVFQAMGMEVEIELKYDKENSTMDVTPLLLFCCPSASGFSGVSVTSGSAVIPGVS